MSVAVQARQPRAPPFPDPPGYARHRPEATLSYQLVERRHAGKLMAFSRKKRGFSLHAGVTIAPHQRGKPERLCRYISRPLVATERLALTAADHVRDTL